MMTSRAGVAAFTTKDGSTVRELMHPGADGNVSLAEAIVPAGGATTRHRHNKTEEIYHILSGEGEMELGAERFHVAAGDTVRIRPGVAHKLTNAGGAPLALLCACAPPYADEDTELLE